MEVKKLAEGGLTESLANNFFWFPRKFICLPFTLLKKIGKLKFDKKYCDNKK